MRNPIIEEVLALLACEVKGAEVLTSPDVVKDYLRLLLADRPHEVFAVVFLDSQHRVLETVELFRGKPCWGNNDCGGCTNAGQTNSCVRNPRP